MSSYSNACTAAATMSGPPHFVDLHVNPGESVSIQLFDGNETVLRGPATLTMISQHTFPPVPMPVQVPPGHMVQQIVDENGTLRHIILSALNNNGTNQTPPPPPPAILPQQQTPAAVATAGYSPYCCCCCSFIGNSINSNGCCPPPPPSSSSPSSYFSCSATASGAGPPPPGQASSNNPLPTPPPPPPSAIHHTSLWELGMAHVEASAARRLPFSRSTSKGNSCNLDMTFSANPTAAIRRRLPNRNYSYSKRSNSGTLNANAAYNGVPAKTSPTSKGNKGSKDSEKSSSSPNSHENGTTILFAPSNLKAELNGCELSTATDQSPKPSKIDYLVANGSASSNCISEKSDKVIVDYSSEKIKSIAARDTAHHIHANVDSGNNHVTTNGIHESARFSKAVSSQSSPNHPKLDSPTSVANNNNNNNQQHHHRKSKKHQDDKSRENTPHKRKQGVTTGLSINQEVCLSPKTSPSHKVNSNSNTNVIVDEDGSSSDFKSKSLDYSEPSLVQSFSEILRKTNDDLISNENDTPYHRLHSTESRVSNKKESPSIPIKINDKNCQPNDSTKESEKNLFTPKLQSITSSENSINDSQRRDEMDENEVKIFDSSQSVPTTESIESRLSNGESPSPTITVKSELAGAGADAAKLSEESTGELRGKPGHHVKSVNSNNSKGLSNDEYNITYCKTGDEGVDSRINCDKGMAENKLYKSTPFNESGKLKPSPGSSDKTNKGSPNLEEEISNDSDSVDSSSDDLDSEEVKKVKISPQRSPKHLLPQIQVFTLSYTSLTATSVKLKWTLDQGNSSSSNILANSTPTALLSEARLHFMVEMMRNNQTNVKNGSVMPVTRIVFQGTQTSCRISHLSSQEQYSFRVRTYHEDHLLVSNILTLVTPEQLTVRHRKSKGQSLQHQSQSYTEFQKHHHHPDQHQSNSPHHIQNQQQFAYEEDEDNSIESSDQKYAIMIISIFTIIAVVVACLIHHFLTD